VKLLAVASLPGFHVSQANLQNKIAVREPSVRWSRNLNLCLVTGHWSLALLAHFALTIFLRLWMSDRLQTSKPKPKAKQNYLR